MLLSNSSTSLSVPQIREPRAEVVKVIPHEYLHQRSVQQSGNRPVPQIAQEIVKSAQTIPQERILERVVE